MPKGIEYELVGPMEHAETNGRHAVDLYVSYEGLEALRDNTSREYSKFFDGLVKQADSRIAEYEANQQDPLPGL